MGIYQCEEIWDGEPLSFEILADMGLANAPISYRYDPNGPWQDTPYLTASVVHDINTAAVWVSSYAASFGFWDDGEPDSVRVVGEEGSE